jgi:hypothetical protein
MREVETQPADCQSNGSICDENGEISVVEHR